MSQISLKSISGITSITTSTGVDNQLTLHTNNTTQAFKLDHAGNLHFSNHVNTTGISSASNFKTGTSNLHSTGLNIFDLDVDGHTNLDNVSIAGVTTITNSGGLADFKAIELEKSGTSGASRINFLENGTIRGGLTYSHDNNRIELISENGESIRFQDKSNNQFGLINSSGLTLNGDLVVDSRVLIGTTTEGAVAADDFTVSSSGDTGITIRSGTTHNGVIHFSDATSGGGEYAGQIDYDHNNDSLNFYAGNDQCLRLLNDKIVSVNNKLVLENGTVFLNKHSVGVGTTTQAGRNAGVSTATGTIIYNAEIQKVQVYANAVWRNVGSLEPEYGTGYYSSLSAAQSAGLSHYWPGNSSTSLISGLQPDDRKGNPTFNNKEHDGYGATYPFFHFAGQTGGDSPTGYRFTHSADWVGHSFAITYWVKVMQEVTEGESTYVQLGNHSGLRSMFAMSCNGNTNLIGKTITIGSDNANDQIQYEFANWIHVGVRYNYGTNAARYFKNGVATETHTFSGGSLSVGTGSNHIYLGYGYWNSSSSNKESCSRMSDIGIWDSTDLNDAIMGDIYRAGRIVKGY